MPLRRAYAVFFGAFSVLLLPLPVLAFNAGFIEGVWYSKDPFFAGETVRVYSAIQNRSGSDLSGVVAFLVDGKEIGRADFSAANGRIAEVWSDWKVSEGKHSVSASVVSAQKLGIGSAPEPVELAASSVRESVLEVDIDTDGDGIGDRQDPDDDNDALSDADEKKLGTDPVKKDSDGDGVFDGDEVAAGTDPKQAEEEVLVVSDTPPLLPDLITSILPEGGEGAFGAATAALSSATKAIDSVAQAASVLANDQGEVLGEYFEEKSAGREGARAIAERLAASVLPAALGAVSFLLHYWPWTLAVGILIWLFSFFRNRYGMPG